MRSSNQDLSNSHQPDHSFPAGAITVRVRIQGKTPLAVIERGPWTEPPLVLWRADGTTEVRASTYDMGMAARWVLEHGNWAEALSPPPLRRRVAAQAWRIYCLYGTDGGLMYEKNV